jgi:hypothetical protein
MGAKKGGQRDCEEFKKMNYNVETVNIGNSNNILSFDEYMSTDGTWCESSIKYNRNDIRLLDYVSSSHGYYLYQNELGEHTILRLKK